MTEIAPLLERIAEALEGIGSGISAIGFTLFLMLIFKDMGHGTEGGLDKIRDQIRHLK